MNYGKTMSVVALSVVATLAIASVTGFELEEIIAEDSTEKKYTMGNDVEVIGLFSFADNTSELVEFQVFEQLTGFNRATESATFELVKELNDQSPLLYKASDMSWKYNSIPGMDYMTEFDVTIFLAKGGDIVRQFEYSYCVVDEYEVKTLYDKEEGWTGAKGKGFAVIDEFEIQCDGYQPVNPTYEDTNAVKKADNISTLDLLEERALWEQKARGQ